MATPHIAAEPGDIAELVLLPGDPKRAQRIASEVLSDVRLVSDVRGNGVYTGVLDQTPVSVMASGMGVPTTHLYATELFRFYGVKRICRVGTCGGISRNVKVRDVVIASHAHTNSRVNLMQVPDVTVSQAASFAMLRGAVAAAEASDATWHVGAVYSNDYFYLNRPDIITALENINTLGVEMESAGLFAAAAAEHGEALTVLTVSDHLTDGSPDMTSDERERNFEAALAIALGGLLA